MEFPSAPTILSSENGQLLFIDPQQRSRFELGVACLIFLWDDMKTAVDSGWGGPESNEKREWAAGTIVDLFESNSVAIEDVEYRLLGIMQDEFDVTLETESAYDVARNVMSVYLACANRDYQIVDMLYQRYEGVGQVRAKVQVQNEDGEDTSESEDDEQESPTNGNPRASEPRIEPVIDEDGFELVQRRR